MTAVTDVAQLILMLVGLLRSRRERRGFLHYLYIQVGVIRYRQYHNDHAEIGLGLAVASRRDNSGGTIRGEF